MHNSKIKYMWCWWVWKYNANTYICCDVVLQFTIGNVKAQRYLLGGFEQLVGNVHPDALLSKVPNILKSFYDLDILDEEVIIEWDKKVCCFFLNVSVFHL